MILPSRNLITDPSGPVELPVSLSPSAMKLNLISTGPLGVSSEAVQFPSMSAANTGEAASSRPSASIPVFMVASVEVPPAYRQDAADGIRGDRGSVPGSAIARHSALLPVH